MAIHDLDKYTAQELYDHAKIVAEREQAQLKDQQLAEIEKEAKALEAEYKKSSKEIKKTYEQNKKKLAKRREAVLKDMADKAESAKGAKRVSTKVSKKARSKVVKKTGNKVGKKAGISKDVMLVIGSKTLNTRQIEEGLTANGVKAKNLAQTLAYLKKTNKLISPSRGHYAAGPEFDN